MHTITFQQKERMGRSPHDLGAVWKLEATVPVPVHGHPKAEHFLTCGAGKHDKPIPPADLERINQEASRITIIEDVQAQSFNVLRVIVDGKYIAGDFSLHADYHRPQKEVEAAQRATEVALELASGVQPSDSNQYYQAPSDLEAWLKIRQPA